jgi:hypothetical protein
MMTSDRLNLYQKQGFVSPVRVCSVVEALAYRQQLEDFEAKHAPIMSTAFRNKPHLVLKWVADLIRNEAILDLAEEILGPNPNRRPSWSRGMWCSGESHRCLSAGPSTP